MHKHFFSSFLFVICLFLSLSLTHAQSEGWSLLADVKFEPRYNDEMGEYLLYPEFGDKVLAADGKKLSITGYVLPIDLENTDYIILSRYTFAQCFFCGQAGPESVVAVYFKTPQKGFVPDQRIKIKGKLIVNATDVNRLNYILEDAVILPLD